MPLQLSKKRYCCPWSRVLIVFSSSPLLVVIPKESHAATAPTASFNAKDPRTLDLNEDRRGHKDETPIPDEKVVNIET